MFLFILESIGTTELLLIGLVALIFLGPRRMPEMARKIGKMMSEFRGTANEFKETWRREVDFEEETKAFDLNALENEPVARRKSIDLPAANGAHAKAPAIKEVDPEKLEQLKARAAEADANTPAAAAANDPNDKQNWL